MDKISESALRQLETQAKKAFQAAKTNDELDAARVEYLGRKSQLSLFLKQLSALSIEEKRSVGPLANAIRLGLDQIIKQRTDELFQSALLHESGPAPDLTLPGISYPYGHTHPLTIVANRVLEVFRILGFQYVVTPEVETEDNNFTALNIPEDHPARDMHDTIYLQGAQNGSRLLLRTHTTPAQIHVMKELPPPYRVVTMGKVFRSEAVDATHLPVFHQIDAFYVDSECSMADLKSTLEIWARELFGPASSRIRFRPSYFPFTEPSCEVEIACFLCSGSGCGTCKNGWIEMLGAGMIHPQILARSGHDPKKWKGFAFGLGLERVAMVLWGIPDIRLFYENNIDFLEQFK